jgi:hypothetical protein
MIGWPKCWRALIPVFPPMGNKWGDRPSGYNCGRHEKASREYRFKRQEVVRWDE